MNLKPIIKWTGGKRKELKHFLHLIPEYKTYIEPFVGGGALYFHLNSQKNIINDFDYLLMNFYKVLQYDSKRVIECISKLKEINNNHEKMEKLYYIYRNKFNNYKDLSLIERLICFLYVNQLSFSGMRRFNKKGEFNVPFGHYKTFNPIITTDHINLLNRTSIYNDDIFNLFEMFDIEDGFMFLDPPYTNIFKEYSSNNVFGKTHQIKLHNYLKNLNKTKWLMVINNDEDILKMYKQYDILSYDIRYGVNIKNRFDTQNKHLIIKNF